MERGGQSATCLRSFENIYERDVTTSNYDKGNSINGSTDVALIVFPLSDTFYNKIFVKYNTFFMLKTLTDVSMEVAAPTRNVTIERDQVWCAAVREGINRTVDDVTVSIKPSQFPNS